MSQPRRRRRRGRRRSGGGGSGSPEQKKRETAEQAQQGDDQPQQRSKARRGRGRRGRTRARDARTPSPKSSEDLVRADPKRPPARLTRDHDGTTLEQVIGELQSEHGVPQHPQEYRITLKVAGERPAGPEETTTADTNAEAATTLDPDKPKREKAPAAPRMGADGSEEEGAAAPKSSRRRRSRRRRRKQKSSGGS